jgi:hypothetical protein
VVEALQVRVPPLLRHPVLLHAGLPRAGLHLARAARREARRRRGREGEGPPRRAAQAHAPAEAAPRRRHRRRARGPRRHGGRPQGLVLAPAAEGPRVRGRRDPGLHPGLQVLQLQGGRRAAVQVRILARATPAAAAVAEARGPGAAGPARGRRWVGRQDDDVRAQVRRSPFFRQSPFLLLPNLLDLN